MCDFWRTAEKNTTGCGVKNRNLTICCEIFLKKLAISVKRSEANDTKFTVSDVW